MQISRFPPILLLGLSATKFEDVHATSSISSFLVPKDEVDVNRSDLDVKIKMVNEISKEKKRVGDIKDFLVNQSGKEVTITKINSSNSRKRRRIGPLEKLWKNKQLSNNERLPLTDNQLVETDYDSNTEGKSFSLDSCKNYSHNDKDNSCQLDIVDDEDEIEIIDVVATKRERTEEWKMKDKVKKLTFNSADISVEKLGNCNKVSVSKGTQRDTQVEHKKKAKSIREFFSKN